MIRNFYCPVCRENLTEKEFRQDCGLNETEEIPDEYMDCPNDGCKTEIIVTMEESDFDFSKSFNELSHDEKADFLSFLKVGFLNDSNRKEIEGMWECYQLKDKVNL